MIAATPLLLGAAAAAATLAGGLLALRLGPRLGPLLAVGAGMVPGIALFDLLPEAAQLGAGRWPALLLAGWAALGLTFYLGLARLPGALAGWRGHLGPATLVLHSLADGLGIGLAWQADPHAGVLVGVAVLAHDLADGASTVALALAARTAGTARRWLLVNGLAPLAGAAAGLHLAVSATLLGVALAALAGAFLAVGLGELWPRAHRLDPRPRTALTAGGGLALALLVAAAR